MARVIELEKLSSGLRKENHSLAITVGELSLANYSRELENVKIPKCFRNASVQTEPIGGPDSKKRKTVDESELIDVMAVWWEKKLCVKIYCWTFIVNSQALEMTKMLFC